MKNLTRREFTAAGILAALGATTFAAGCKRQSDEDDPATDYDPEENEVVTVYGPPEDYEPEANELADVYGPPPDYDAEDNIVTALYGPPEEYESSVSKLIPFFQLPIDD